MINRKSINKGTIIVAVIFILCITIGLSAVISLFWSKTPLSVSRLKRFQAINYAEAGLYEAFNRFREGSWNPNENKAYPPIHIDGVAVNIVVDAHLGRRRVSATVDQDNFNL
jgi:hypothetical protein